MALSLVFAFATGCKEQAPAAPAGEPAEQPAPVSVDKPVAAEAVGAPGLPAPAAAASPAATSSPPPAAPAAVPARSEPDKHAGGSNAAAPSLLASPQATATATAVAPPAPAPIASVAKAEPPAVEVTSPKVTEAAFNLWMQSSGRYKAGQQGHVEIVLVPKGDYHCNEQYPYKFKPAPSAGVTFPQVVVTVDSMSKGAARSVMRVPFVPASPGDARVAGKFHFSVCTASQCLMDSREVAVTVKVD